MSNSFSFHNPYNFVRPITGKKTGAYDEHTILMDRCEPPPHDRYVGYSGRLHCVAKIKTPMIIGQPKGGASDSNISTEFFKARVENGSEIQAIPSSSLRGVIRSVFEAITNSCFSIFDETKLFKRMKPQESLDLVPARIEKNEDGKWILRLLKGENDNREKAAWILSYRKTWKRQKTNSKPYFKRKIVSDINQFKHGKKYYAVLEPMKRPRKGKIPPIHFYNVVSLHKKRPDALGKMVREGYVYKRGLPRKERTQHGIKKHDERFFFPVDSEEKIDLTKDVVDAYNSLLEERNENRCISVGNLVWAKVDIHKKMVEYLVPVAISKYQYDTSRGFLLEKMGLEKCNDYSLLCPACRMFGWVFPEEADKSTSDDYGAYRGRVRFSPALISEVCELEKPIYLPLSSPKPTATFFYLLDNGHPSIGVDYDSRDADLRGRKFYLHHRRFDWQDIRKIGEPAESYTCIIEYAPPSSVFEFDVEFENLGAAELGALSWSLQLENDMFHRMGIAKPYGFGSVKIQIDIDKSYLFKMSARYNNGDWKTPLENDRLDAMITIFKDAMTHLYISYEQFIELPNFVDLKEILSGPDDDLPIHYPRCEEKASTKTEGFKWFMKAEKQGKSKYALPTPNSANVLDSKVCKDNHRKKKRMQQGPRHSKKSYKK